MPKIKVTSNLGISIKKLRVDYNIKANKVAEKINKSGSYITKLEKGEVNTIDYNELIDIIIYIIGNKQNLNDILENIIDYSSICFTKEEFNKEEEWMLNFDTVTRKIPVPQTLVTFIKEKLIELNINLADLVKYININEDLNDENIDFSNYEKNFWHLNNGKPFIINDIEYTLVDDILNKKINVSNYISIEAIIYHLLKKSGIEKYTAYIQTIEILNKEKFYSLREKSILIDKQKSIGEINELLDEFDNENIIVVNNILRHLQTISQIHVKYANEKLELLLNNLNYDPILTIAFAAIDITKLKDKNIKIKREFVKNVEDLIIEYRNKIEDDDKLTLV